MHFYRRLYHSRLGDFFIFGRKPKVLSEIKVILCYLDIEILQILLTMHS
ncbi:hypothetical protein CNEO2_480008 [Clostridium neonatale]|nr:hypothetical protein CNEO2_1820003 [Clostridium neonatale]CAI3670887.1 hypothetical protein CNEO2_480008 [Clostridium neonatale]